MQELADNSISLENINKCLILLTLLIPLMGFAKQTETNMFVSKDFILLRSGPSQESEMVETLKCGQKVKFDGGDGEWVKVDYNTKKGYALLRSLSDKRTACFSQKYSKFYYIFDLSYTDQILWGKLNEYFLEGKSSVRN